MVEGHIDNVPNFPAGLDRTGITGIVDADIDGQMTGSFQSRLVNGGFHHFDLVAARHQQGQATYKEYRFFHNYQVISSLNPLKPGSNKPRILSA